MSFLSFRPASSSVVPVALLAILGLALSTSAAFGAGPHEPNDTFAQAAGPLVGGKVYTAEIETQNDLDHFYFNTSGQAQLDVAVTSISGCGTSTSSSATMDLVDFEGNAVGAVALYTGSGNNTRHILYTAPSRSQYVLRTDSNQKVGCKYSIRIDPPSAVTIDSPGVEVKFGGDASADDLHGLAVNGQPVASAPGNEERSISLGPLAADATIGLSAQNTVGQWGWSFSVTNLVGRQRTTWLSERQSGGSSDAPRVGTVRSVVINGAGAILSSCGEAVAPVLCFPVDQDRDGYRSADDCDDANGAISPGAREIVDNAVDENCDGVVAKYARYRSSISLMRERVGKRYLYRGRVTSGEGCLARRTVTMRRRGSGQRSFGQARTSANGTFTISRRTRLRGRVYAVVTGRQVGLVVCRSATSKRIWA